MTASKIKKTRLFVAIAAAVLACVMFMAVSASAAIPLVYDNKEDRNTVYLAEYQYRMSYNTRPTPFHAAIPFGAAVKVGDKVFGVGTDNMVGVVVSSPTLESRPFLFQMVVTDLNYN